MYITGPQRWAGRQRWSIATRKSASIFAALAAIATATWMAGRKEKHGQRWSLAAAWKKLWVPISVKRVALLHFSKNGMRTAISLSNLEKGNPRTDCLTRESTYSKAS